MRKKLPQNELDEWIWFNDKVWTINYKTLNIYEEIFSRAIYFLNRKKVTSLLKKKLPFLKFGSNFHENNI